MLKYGWYLKNTKNHEDARRRFLADIEESKDSDLKRLERMAFSFLENNSIYKPLFVPDVLNEYNLTSLMKSCAAPHITDINDHKEFLNLLSNLEETKNAVIQRLSEIRQKAEKIKIHATRGIVWGFIFSIIGLIFCSPKFSYWGYIPLVFGIIKIICNFKNHSKMQEDVLEVDKMVSKYEDDFYAAYTGYDKVAYKVNNFLVNHYYYFNGAANYPKL